MGILETLSANLTVHHLEVGGIAILLWEGLRWLQRRLP